MAGRLATATLVGLLAANCSTDPQKFAASGSGVDPKYGVKASPRLYNEGDEIPKGGGRRFSGKPYVVAGKTYVPREDARGYTREGLASWYGSAFHGRMTANGEVFDRHSIAAAHPTLPLPSYARVTNLENGYSMVVRVNDRGPYHAGRVMDVSEEAARALEFHRKGTAHVRVEYVGKASVAGSDDRKLLATLRTDGQPAPGRSSVMVADLGPAAAPEAEESFARRAPVARAFKPDEEPAGATPRPAAPIVLASAAVAVPAAIQPGTPRAAFHASPVPAVAGLNPGTQPPATVVAARPVQARSRFAEAPVAPKPAAKPVRPAASARAPAPVKVAAGTAQAPMSSSAKLAMGKLAAAASAPGKAGPLARHSRLAEIY